jgi:hypothetical protein
MPSPLSDVLYARATIVFPHTNLSTREITY